MTIFKRKKEKEVKPVKKESRKAVRKKIEDKESARLAKERLDSFKLTLEKVSKFEKINGFVVLVDAEGDKALAENSCGVCSMCGPKPTLYKLLANVDKEFLNEALNFQDLKNSMNGLTGVLDELSKLMERLNEKSDK